LLPAPEKPIACYVTDRIAFPAETCVRDVLARIRAAAEAGADWVQIREKDLGSGALYALVRDALALVADVRRERGAATRVIVNGRLDVAVACGADGVHLGYASVPAQDAIRWCHNGGAPREFIVGVSCHSLEDARSAEAAGADYVFFGPVFDSPSKREFGAPQGAAKLREVARALRIPLIAIGGINASNARECLQTGAAGVAAIREFQDSVTDDRARNFVEAVHSGT
jgi:thiamine-phosphate pyrophosphorylase